MQVLQIRKHQTCVKEYVEADRLVVRCTVCGIEVGFNPEERSGLDGATLLFKNLPCLSQSHFAGRVS